MDGRKIMDLWVKIVGHFSMELVVSVDGVNVYERYLKIGKKGLVGDIKGCVRDLSEDFGLEGGWRLLHQRSHMVAGGRIGL